MKKISLIISAIAILLLGASYSSEAFWFGAERGDEPLVFEGPQKISIQDDGFSYQISTQAKTVEEFLQKEDIEIGDHDLVFPSVSHEIIPGMNIKIKRSLPYLIEVDGGEIEGRTFRKTIGEVLNEAGVKLAPLDKINHGKTDLLREGMEITVTRIEIEEVEKNEVIEFKTIEKEDDDLKWRKKIVAQEGESGAKKVKYKKTYKNGKLIDTEIISTEITKEPVDEIIKIGTKIEVGDTQKGLASWYRYTGTMACASITFPKGTWLRVTNRNTGKQVIVQVNDYGPMASTGKIIDLDSVAFKKIGNLSQGVLDVKVEEILD